MHTTSFFFFFQAEDGIRDLTVTGVQTCALPIWFGGITRVAQPMKTASFALLNFSPVHTICRRGPVRIPCRPHPVPQILGRSVFQLFTIRRARISLPLPPFRLPRASGSKFISRFPLNLAFQ